MLGIRLFASLFLLLHLIASYYPSVSWNWGFWHWQVIPKGLREICFITALSLVWFGSDWLARQLTRLNFLTRPAEKKYQSLIIAIVVIGVLWLGRNRVVSGDMVLIQNETLSGAMNPSRYGVLFYSITANLHFSIIHLVRNIDWDHAFIVYSNSLTCCLLGVLYFFLLRRLVRRWSTHTPIVGLVFMLTLGMSQVFLGHREVYAIVIVAVLSVILSWESANLFSSKPSRNPVGLALALGLATMVHPSGSFLWFPTILAIGFKSAAFRQIMKGSLNIEISTWGQRFFVFSLLSLLFWFGLCFCYNSENFTNFPVYLNSFKANRHFVSLAEVNGQAHQYSLVSTQHLLNFINHQMLLSPWALLGLFFFRRSVKHALRKWHFRIILIAAVPYLVFSLIANPDLGPLDDWDMYSLSAWMLSLPMLYIISEMERDGELKKLMPIIVVQVVHTGPWIMANAMGGV